jgi:hypothetical protein
MVGDAPEEPYQKPPTPATPPKTTKAPSRTTKFLWESQAMARGIPGHMMGLRGQMAGGIIRKMAVGMPQGALPATTKTTNTTKNHKNTHKTTKTVKNHQHLMVGGAPGRGGPYQKPPKPATTTNKRQHHQNHQKPPKSYGSLRKRQGVTQGI